MTERPPSIWHPSPNFRPGRTQPISCVVIHATATAALGSPLRELCDPKPDNPGARVSAHYLIDLDGTIYYLVNERDTAWHAGYSIWRGRQFVNNFSVGIELVNLNDGQMHYPDEQMGACAALVKAIMADHGIERADVTGHAEIVDGKTPAELAERRKLHSDPGAAFDWNDFYGRLAT